MTGFFINSDTESGGTDGIMGNTAVEVYSTTDPNGGCTGNLDVRGIQLVEALAARVSKFAISVYVTQTFFIM